MFPTASSTIYRNEDGEVLGWDNNYDDAPDYDPFDRDTDPDEDLYWQDESACREAGVHGDDANENSDGTWTCCRCDGDCTDEAIAHDDYEGGEDSWLDGSYEES
jgi:hypothetical protein